MTAGIDSQTGPGVDLRARLWAHLRTLPLCHVSAPSFPAARAASWIRVAAAVGRSLPLGLAHDLGLLLALPAAQRSLAQPTRLPPKEDTACYLAFLHRLAAFLLVRELPTWQPPLTDTVIAVVLVRLIEGLEFPDMYRPPSGAATMPFVRSLTASLEAADPAAIWSATPPETRPSWSRLLPEAALDRIERNLRGLDRDELRFLVHYGTFLTGVHNPRDLLDLLALIGLPPAARLVLSRSIRLLPCVSEPRSTGGLQAYPEGGYEGLARTGSLDSLLPSEVAYPNAIFLHRLLNKDALYYGRERQHERRRELAYVVVQAGWGMGGDGQVLAQALLLALCQAMSRRGYDVQYSFAGAQLDQPRALDRPGEIWRILYHHDPARADAERTLRDVLRRVKNWRPAYRGRKVLWVLGEHFDADEADAHPGLYADLRAEAGQQVWYVRVGGGPRGTEEGVSDKPVTAKYFESWQVLETAALWSHRT